MALMNDCCNSQFDLFRSTERMYIDKSLLIKDILERNENGRFLYTRPRRFGKSMNRSMLDCFFNIKYKDNNWFDGLKISEYHRFDVHKNRYPVINLDLMQVMGSDLADFKSQIRALIRDQYLLFPFLTEDERIQASDRQFISSVIRGDCNVDWIYTAIPTLMRVLHHYYGEPVVVLIDEYDHGLTSSASNKDLDEMTKVLSVFLGSIMKTSPDAKFVYVTGVAQLCKAGLFSGVNNLYVDSITDSDSGDRFGFTEDEVLSVLENIGRTDDIESVRRYYDGYLIGGHHIYNPFSIIKYASEQKLDPYWIGTSNTNPMETMLNRMNTETVGPIFTLINGGSIQMAVDDSFNYNALLDPDFKGLISLMVMTGYLTAKPSDDGEYDVYIPNEEVRQSVRRIMNRAVPLSNSNVDVFVQAFMDVDRGRMESRLGDILAFHSYFDLKDESSYAIILMQVLSSLITRYDVRAQVESGNGRVDMMLRPVKDGLPSVVIGVKKVGKEKKLGKALDEALEQIHDRRYTMGMKGRVILMGFAFWGKVPSIRIEETVV